MYRVTASVIDDQLVIKSTKFDFKENKLSYKVYDSSGEISCLVQKDELGKIIARSREDRLNIPSYSIWSLTPDGEDILRAKINEQIDIRIACLEKFKSWNK